MEDNRPFITVGYSDQYYRTTCTNIIPKNAHSLMRILYMHVSSKYSQLNVHTMNSISTNHIYHYIHHNIKINMFPLAYV
jgi:hypothetical protein